MVTLLSWNVHGLNRWSHLINQLVDLALLQEAPRPPGDYPFVVVPDRVGPWGTNGWGPQRRTAVASVSDAVHVRRITEVDVADGTGMVTSRPGTITAADVIVDDGSAFTAVVT